MSQKEAIQYFETLKECIDKKKPVLDVLKKIPKKLYPEVGELINPFVAKLSKHNTRTGADYYRDRSYLLFKIKYFFEDTRCMVDHYIPDYSEELDELVEVYIRPDLDKIINQSFLGYFNRMAFYKKGYIKKESSDQFAMSLKDMPHKNQLKNVDAILPHLYVHEETLADDIWLTFHPRMYFRDEMPLWQDLLIKLIEIGKIPRAKVLQTIIELGVSGKKLSKLGSSTRQGEVREISWFFKIMKSLKPSKPELMTLQSKILKAIDSELPTVKKINLEFVKKICTETKFKSKVFLKKADKMLSTANLTQAKLVLATLDLMVKKEKEPTADLIAVAQNGLTNKDEKVQNEIQAFVEKHADKSTIKAVKAKIEKQQTPKEITAADLGGWTEEELEKISLLLLSVQDDSVKIAFSLLENREFPKILLSEIFATGKLTEDKALKETAYTIIRENGSDNVIKQLDSKLSLGSGNSLNPPTEKTIKRNIKAYVADNELDGLKIAQALYKKCGSGISYLLDENMGGNQKETFKTFITGTTLELTGAALTKFPPIIFEFPALTVINLSGNKIGAIPSKINIFKNLKVLNLANNSLKTIQKNIASLTDLEELYLNNNKVKDGIPAHLFELTNLKRLDLTNCQEQDTVYELPMNILNLKKLEFFKLDFKDWYRTHDSYSNYPQIKEVTGNPINMEPLAIAEAAFDQGDLSPTSYIFKHGDTKLKKKVLDYYYDKTTKEMNFQEHFVAELPKEILSYDIEILNLNRCGMGKDDRDDTETVDLEELQKTALISKMKNLKELYLGMNRFTELSDLSGLTKLTKLQLTNMRISKLFDLSKLKNLEILKMGSLNLTKLPPEIFKLTKLTHLNLNSAFGRTKVRFTSKDFEQVKNLIHLKEFTLSSYQFKEEQEHEKVKAFLVEGCVFKEY